MSTIVKNGKQRYLIGLSWRHENEKPIFSYVKSLAIDNGSTMSVVRKSISGAWQIGLGSADNGKIELGSRSLSAAIADSMIESVSLLCPIPNTDLYWYLAIRDGEVLPDGDFVGNQYDCLAIRSQYQDVGVWDISEECDLSTAFSYVISRKQKKDSFIKNATQQVNLVLPIVFFIALILMIGGYWFWHKKQQEIAIEAKAKMLKERRLAEERAIMMERKIPPWTKHPGTESLLLYCREKFVHTYPFINGWQLDKWSCSIGDDNRIQVVSEYMNIDGVANNAPGVLKFGANDKSIDTSISNPILVMSGIDVSRLKSQDQSGRELFSTANSLQSIVHIGGASPSIPPLPGVSSGSMSDASKDLVNNGFNFTLNSNYSPFINGFRSSFSNVSVTIIKGMTWTLSGSKWQINGVVYFTPGKD